jgi:hypothetical protein
MLIIFFNFWTAFLYFGMHPYYNHIKVNSLYADISGNTLITYNKGYLNFSVPSQE